MNSQGTDPTGKHTPYSDVTPGYWWARYEGFGHRQEWRLVIVKGHAPFYEVFMALQHDSVALPMRYEGRSPAGSDVYIEYELWFYNEVEGPPSDDE